MPSRIFSRRTVLILFLVIAAFAHAAAKPHIIALGKTIAVQWTPGLGEKNQIIKLRPLLVDARVKEFTLGPAHDVTDRLFVVRGAFRLNDSLPQESATPHWQWQRGGWLLVDRVTGRISFLDLPDFDPVYSAVSWYRDYAAYCGISDDGKKIFAIVAQIGHRKPVLKKSLEVPPIAENAAPDSACPTPTWQRNPARVTFEPTGEAKQTFAIRGHTADLVTEEEDEEDAQEETKK